MAAEIDRIVQQAAALRDAGRVDDAIAALTGALAHDVDGAVAWQLAAIAAERADWPQAEAFGRRALRDGGPRHANGVGQILAKAGKPDEALDLLALAHRHDPTDVAPLVYRCALLSDRQQYDEALACLEQVLALVPDHPFGVMRERIDVERAFLTSVRALWHHHAGRHGVMPDGASSAPAIAVPSASVHADGTPRFHLWFTESLVARDFGAAHLFQQELTKGGYELPLRRFLDAYLASDDVFIDVGAHWGVHALTAATLRPGEIDVVAIEGHPDNSGRLRAWVERNGLELAIDVVAAAAGDHVGTATMTVNGSTMGHTLSTGTETRGAAPAIDVPLVTLDAVRETRPHLRWRRTFLKIDVEGYEWEVLQGAQDLLASGDLAAVIWENGDVHARSDEQRRSGAILDWLAGRGFVHHGLETEAGSARVVPLVPGAPLPNDIVSLRPDVRPT